MTHWVFNAVEDLEDRLCALLMAVILLVLGLQIVSRYLVGDPPSWTEEVSRQLFVWMVFLGASGAVRTRSHIAIDVLTQRLGRRARQACLWVWSGLTLFFLGQLIFWGGRAVGRVWPTQTATLEISMGIVYLILPISALCMTLRLLQNLHDDLRGVSHDGSLLAPTENANPS